MLLVPCPNCGPRDASDFRFSGESHARPNPDGVSAAEWRDHLYTKDNVADWQRETWYCRACRSWFSTERNTLTNQFRRPPVDVRAGENGAGEGAGR